MNGFRYRVVAPSIRIVPWTALASCWPLPQQLLPVSAAGGGRRRCTLAMFSGRIILNFGISERLRAFRYPIFTGGVVEKNSICSAAFCESAALRIAFSPFFMGKSATVDRQFSSTPPSVKMGYRNARRRSDIPKFKIIFQLKMARAQRKPFQIVHSAKKGCCTHGAAAFFCLRM